MPSYVTITEAETDPGAPGTSELWKKWRDNPLAMAEGATGAPVIQQAWHPFDMVEYGDGNDGVIYDSAVDGSVASIVTPDFADGFEYRLVLNSLLVPDAVGLRIELYRETGAAYSAALTIATGNGTSVRGVGEIELPEVRNTRNGHRVNTRANLVALSNLSTAANQFTQGVISHLTAQKILRARLTLASGNITAGVVIMERRIRL